MAVRQLEQQVKSILDSIAVSEERKRDLIRGDAVDKAEQLSESLSAWQKKTMFDRQILCVVTYSSMAHAEPATGEDSQKFIH